MLKNLKASYFTLLSSIITLLLFHYPFFKFVISNIDYRTFNGVLLITSLIILMVVINFFSIYLILAISKKIAKILLILFFCTNAMAIYFINTYNIIIDEAMISNILNTKYEEFSSFFSLNLIFYLFFLGIIPSILVIKVQVIKETLCKSLIMLASTLILIIVVVVANANNILWIDHNSKQLGGLAMPWSYVVNTPLFYIHQAQRNKKEILLPNATIKDNEKSVVVLVIGESARRQNFSLYGYTRNTNPLLSQIDNLYYFDANSSATYTSAGLKSILDHKPTNNLYEILPNYLYRNNVDVIWKTTNWGEPPVHIDKYLNKEDLRRISTDKNLNYDQVLLTNLKKDILLSTKNKILIVLHTSTSHGPAYNTKYPLEFEIFSPVCKSVELANCSQQELINAYDNTIVYTDFILSRVIQELKELKNYKSAMLYISDHGESLGEKNLYMHGLPMSIAPKEQYEIPLIVWVSENSKQLKVNEQPLSQYHIFHSTLNFLNIDSPIYNKRMNIFE